MSKNDFNYQISNDLPPANLDTQFLFDSDYCETPGLSALSLFFQKTQSLISLAKPEMSDPLPNLLVLGYVSAVESYLREIIRKLVIIDIPSQKKCEDKSITYGAATAYSDEMLPDALLENYSFAGKKNIVSSLTNFLGITMQQSADPDLDNILENFSKVCQVRHCLVHRFGQFGSINAIELGLRQHEEFLGKPIRLNFQTLQVIFVICSNTVKMLNNFLFREILSRTVKESCCNWSWDFETDRETFEKYFAVFSSDESQASIKDAYEAFKKAYAGSKWSR